MSGANYTITDTCGRLSFDGLELLSLYLYITYRMLTEKHPIAFREMFPSLSLKGQEKRSDYDLAPSD
jgi:hypothetical protein